MSTQRKRFEVGTVIRLLNKLDFYGASMGHQCEVGDLYVVYQLEDTSSYSITRIIHMSGYKIWVPTFELVEKCEADGL